MTEIDAIGLPGAFDPLAGAGDLGNDTAGAREYVHIRIQQRNGKKCLTTVQGIEGSFDLKKILKALKKEHCCNGNGGHFAQPGSGPAFSTVPLAAGSTLLRN